MTLPRYQTYKDSGVEWLGRIPCHWALTPLKHAADFINGDAFKPDEWVESGIPIIRIQNLNGGGDFNYISHADQRYLVNEGDLLFGWSGNRGTSFGPFIWSRPGVHALNQHIFRVVPRALDRRELYWTLKAVTSHVEEQAHGIIGMVHITKGDLGSIKIPIPAPDEQVAIAAFLDREAAKIDALIAEQERLLELLAEKRQAVISHVVTKGLNPDLPMKDSGVAWLGDVPAHWSILRIKHCIASIEQGWSPQCDGVPVESDAEWGVLKVGCVNGGVFRPEENKRLPDDLDPLPGLALIEGDVLVSRANTRELVGGAAVVERSYGRLLLCDKLYRIRTNPKALLPSYLARWLGSDPARSRIQLDASGASSSMLNIGQAVILEMFLPVPPIEEQHQIVERLRSTTAAMERAQELAKRSIALLHERRSALIAAAVTGQIDVREAA